MTGSILGKNGKRYSGRIVEFRSGGVIVIVYKGHRVAGRNADLPPRGPYAAGKV